MTGLGERPKARPMIRFCARAEGQPAHVTDTRMGRDRQGRAVRTGDRGSGSGRDRPQAPQPTASPWLARVARQRDWGTVAGPPAMRQRLQTNRQPWSSTMFHAKAFITH